MFTSKSIQKGLGKRKCPNRSKRYKADFKLKAVKLFIEESVPLCIIQKEIGTRGDTVRRWVRLYRKQGEAGLQNRQGGPGKPRLPSAVKHKIIEVKKANPLFGIKRISQFLKRAFFLSASPETVRRTLHGSALMPPPVKKRQHNITRPRFFERSTPNQLWQTDIFTFRLGGRYAFLIGYIDDYSRYITGLDLFRSQTAENVIEVYRRAISEYSPPKEMLTDNGRQYTSWRGNSRFENELKKERIHHIKSQPHHPMTLGKIERFWKSIFLEFLSRAQFESFEDAQERIRQWVKYYNHKRPHQGIGGLCPADRYFEIQTQLRKTIEQGIQDNLLEMALRGKPRLPFYMVGRMEGQSVVLRAEKGKLRLSVDDTAEQRTREVVYNLNEEGTSHGEDREKQNPEETAGKQLWSDGEMPGGALDMDGAAQAGGGMPGTEHTLDGTLSVAEEGVRGDAAGIAAENKSAEGTSAQSPAPGDAAEDAGESALQRRAGQVGEGVVEGATERQDGAGSFQGREEIIAERGFSYGSCTGYGNSPSACDDSVHGAQWADQRRGGRPSTGDIAQELLPVGEPGVAGNDQGDGGPAGGKTGPAAGPGENMLAAEGGGAGEKTLYRRENGGSTGSAACL
jgi:transposase InsO family protein